MVLSPTLGSPAKGSCTSEINPPQNICLWRPAGLTFGRPRGRWEIETPFLKGKHKTSHDPRQKQKFERSLVQTHWLILKSFPERQEVTRTYPGDRHCSSHFQELILPHGHWCCQAPFFNPPSSLLALGPSSTYQSVSTSIETPQAKPTTQVGTQPHSPAGRLMTPWANRWPWHSPYTRQALVPGPPRPCGQRS